MKTKNIKRSEYLTREFIESIFYGQRTVDSGSGTLIGNIDSFSGAGISGWARDTKNIDKHLDLEVYAGELLVGRGEASHYRDDLKTAGHGNGFYGFNIQLDSRVRKCLDQKLTLRDAVTGSIVLTNEKYVEQLTDYVAHIVGIRERRILGEVSSDTGPLENLSVEILVDNSRRLPCSQKVEADAKVLVEAVITEDLFDGLPHCYEVVVNHANCYSAVYIDAIHAVTTADEYLTDSHGKAGYPFAPKIALHRYQSLSRLLQQAVTQKASSQSLENLLTAHQALESGPCERNVYKPLMLPAVEAPDVSIIVPVRNHFAQTYHCIASLLTAHNEATYEVILVDDTSTDQTVQAEAVFGNIEVIRNETNKGYLLSNNLGVHSARGRYICLLNNDTEVTSGWIDQALDTFKCYEGVGAVGCKLIYPDGSLQEAGGLVWEGGVPWNYGKHDNASHPRYNYVRQADYLSAAALFVDINVWKMVAGFSEEYAPAYYEDTDLAYKIREAGYKTLYCPMSCVVHFEGVSNGTDTGSGIKAYQEKNAAKFRARWRKEFIGYSVEGYKPELEVDRKCHQRVLVIDANTPRLNNDAGSFAAIQEMKLLLELGSKVVFLPLNFAHMGVHTERLQKLGVECLTYPFYTSLDQVLQARGAEFDLIYITRYETVRASLKSIRQYSNAKIMFNNADLHFMRELREQLQIEGRDLRGPLATREKEIEAIKSVDITLCYTETERAIIASHVFEEERVVRCPWVVKTVTQSLPFSERNGIAFLGGYRHRPNVDAVVYFCNEIIPLLKRRIPDIVFRVYGSGLPEDFHQYASDNVEIIGFVENVSEVFEKTRVFVSPLRTGAGLNGKMIDCMAHGLPSVISPLTADGTGLVHRQSTFIPETAEEWAEFVADLYTNEPLWNQFSSRSIEIAETLFSSGEGLKRMSGILGKIGLYTDNNGQGLFSEFNTK